MTTPRDTAIAILEAAAPAVGAGLAAVPVAGPILGPAVTAGLGLVVDLIRAGADVPIEIERIRRSDVVLAAARAEERLRYRLEERFPRPAAPAWSEPPDTDPGPVRHETEPSMPAVTEDIYADED